VEVWAARLDVTQECLASFWLTLSEHERQRADRFLLPRGRARFVAARGWLRSVLGQCLGIAPEVVEFGYGPAGKPSLRGRFARQGLQFNLSHSGDLALFGLAHCGLVGVDVEELRPILDLSELIERHFSPAEVAEIKHLTGAEALEALFRIWTRKEACLKATGEGIGDSLASIDVSGRHGPPGSRLRLYDLAPAPGFLGALAVAPD
jgi:4'-phosphopantetheinyl transferase